jgi:MoxR-like ATPase
MSERSRLVLQEVVPGLEAMTRQLPQGQALSVRGSNGKGNSAKVPWVRVFDPKQSPSPTAGWYVVLLFAADGSKVALSLNQGVTRLSSTETARNVALGKRLLAASTTREDTARDDRAVEDINLADPGLGAKYESGHLLGFQYEFGAVPDDNVIAGDLAWLLARLKVLPTVEDAAEVNELQALDSEEVQHPLETLCAAILWPEEKVLEIFEGLMDESPQIILSGPPGTGKTFVAQHLAAYLLDTPGEVKNNPYIEVVQFHPSYGYEDFVEGLRPSPAEQGLLEFRSVPGVIPRMADDMAKDGLPRVLIIDEMNRANLPRVFGELMYLLEYRDQDIRLMHRERFSLPKNLYIIGTMNTADRSAKSLDLALRRRFDFFEVPPDVDILRRYYGHDGNRNQLGESLFRGFEELNSQLTARLDRHHRVGHSYLMKSSLDAATLKRVWTHQLQPLVEDYFFDRPHLAEEFELTTFWPDVSD